MNAQVLLLYGGNEPTPLDIELANRLRNEGSRPDVVLVTVEQIWRLGKDDFNRDMPCVVVTLPSVQEPLHLARLVAAERPFVFFVFVVDSGQEARVRQAAVYGAPPGGRWNLVASGSDELFARVDASLRAAGQQRRFRATVDKIALQLARTTQVDEPEYRRLVASDQYLANVLLHAHDAIVSLTPEGDVVTLNVAAETMLAVKTEMAVGRPFGPFVDNPAAVDEALKSVINGEKARRDIQICRGASTKLVDAIFAALGHENARVIGVTVIMRDVTEQRRLESEAKVADQRKDEFLAMLAHELRNPLAPIRNAGEMLRLMGSNDERIRKAGELISRQSEHMSGLLGDLLDVSRVTRGLVQLNKAMVLPSTFILRAVEQVRDLIDKKLQHLTITRAADVGMICGDEYRLTQIVTNLLHNAAKFTPDNGKIDLNVEATDDTIELQIIDNGIGIERSLIPHIFDLFTQAERSLDRANGGLGIGLALVKSLVGMHGGHVVAKSAGAGLGSTFIVTFPRYRPADGSMASVSETELANIERQNILVVDDNEDAAVSLKMIIELGGHKVRVAYSGAEALELVVQHRFNAFILDIGMPDMDGLQLAARLRKLPQSHDSLLIAHTGYGQPEDRVRTREAGFDHHLTKPTDPLRLLQLIENH